MSIIWANVGVIGRHYGEGAGWSRVGAAGQKLPAATDTPQMCADLCGSTSTSWGRHMFYTDPDERGGMISHSGDSKGLAPHGCFTAIQEIWDIPQLFYRHIANMGHPTDISPTYSKYGTSHRYFTEIQQIWDVPRVFH
ncbi:hypothetical protein C8R44DRAFT_751597 [Mycena epipterygia]|nr:hypothetical protein C8R44DRAFT_751597 [Mycena epipterygia]